MIYPRLVLLRDFLSKDGSIWVSIDDSEGHYIKVMMDEIFGRHRFVASNVWQKRYSRENREAIGDVHEYILVYANDPKLFKATRNLVLPSEQQLKVYRNPNNDPRGRWRPIPMTAQEGHATDEQFYEIKTPSGKIFKPSEGRCWSLSESTFNRLNSEGKIYFGKNGDSQPNVIRYMDEVEGFAPWTWWPNEDVGHTDEAKKEIHALFGKVDAFDTPKPERLLERILRIATNKGDLVLDSFVGSGTTAAVAHKMGRRYIAVEMSRNAETLCTVRLEKVIAGDNGGISDMHNWKGGGGFRFYKLGEPVFLADGAINPQVRFKALAGYVWHFETGLPAARDFKSPVLGAQEGTTYYLLYNGILGDKRPAGGNVLTQAVLAELEKVKGAHARAREGRRVIYGEKTSLSERRLAAENIVFKQIPYEIKAR